MDGFQHFVAFVLPYITVPLYLMMLGYRFWGWLRMYRPAVVLVPGSVSVYRTWSRQYKPTIELFPGHRSRSVEILRTLKGFLFFSGLYRRDRALWFGSWTFHVALGVVAVSHLRIIWDFSALGPVSGIGSEAIGRTFSALGRVGGGALLASALYLLVRRLLVKRVRQITSRGDYVAELLILAVLLTGNAMRFWRPVDIGQAGAYCIGLVTFSRVPPPADPAFTWHLLLGQLLLLYMPFSHLLHFGGIFLSRKFLGSSDSFAGDFGGDG